MQIIKQMFDIKKKLKKRTRDKYTTRQITKRTLKNRNDIHNNCFATTVLLLLLLFVLPPSLGLLCLWRQRTHRHTHLLINTTHNNNIATRWVWNEVELDYRDTTNNTTRRKILEFKEEEFERVCVHACVFLRI